MVTCADGIDVSHMIEISNLTDLPEDRVTRAYRDHSSRASVMSKAIMRLAATLLGILVGGSLSPAHCHAQDPPPNTWKWSKPTPTP
jgi:hypothetical protein